MTDSYAAFTICGMGSEEDTISEAMKVLANRRWGKATPADRKAQGKKMAAGRKKARRKRGAK